MDHIVRMEKELEELKERANKLSDFLDSEVENKKFTDEEQRIYMGIQLSHMNSYINILELRIENDKEKLSNTGA